MTLRRKLLLSLLLPAALLGLLWAIGLVSLGLLEAAAGRILADNYQTVQEARQMERALFQLAMAPSSANATDSPSVGHASPSALFEAGLKRCESNITEAGEKDVLKHIRRDWQRLSTMARGSSSKDALVRRTHRRLVSALHADIQRLITLNEHAMRKHERGARRVAWMMRAAVTGTSAAALLALALFALIAARRIARPVTAVADRLHQALNPDTSDQQAPSPKSVDEIARLGEELEALLGRMAQYEDEQTRKLDHLHWRLVFVMDRVFEGLVLIDAERRILALNRVAGALLGEEASEGVTLDAITPSDEVRLVLQPLMEGEVRQERDLGEVRQRVDGEDRIYRPRVVSVPGGEGTIEGHLIVFWDVTEQRRFEESRRQFISMLSHQLKTPMTSLSMAVSLLREALPEGRRVDPAQVELLGIAGEDCSNLAALISELIEAARGVSPDLSLARRKVDIVRLLRSALRPLVSQAEEKEVSLVLPAGDRGVFANIDPVKFPWVITNIVGNAIRYTPAGGVIRVEVEQLDQQLEVRVSDTGTGISPENLTRIFQPYISLDQKPKPGTHGLGLAIAKEIVEAHGGWIEAGSEPGQGTTFRLQVPR